MKIKRSHLLGVSLAALACCSGNVFAQATLLTWWKLDESSGTTANDDSAYGNNGTLQNMDGSEWTTGQVDNGLNLDGAEDYIDTGIASNLANTITMMAWFNSDDAGSIGDNYVAQRFLSQRDASNSSRLALGINLDRVAVFWDDGGLNTQGGTTTLVAGDWYHAAVTYDGTTVRLYLNGIEEGNWAEASMSTPTTDTFMIGANFAATRLFNGVLDDARLYSRALCAAEVAAIHAQGAGGVRIVSWREVDPYP
ncbi:MAG: LamG domain-containing protein [Phycisphaerales bacterium]